jgi:cell division protease FtsH
MMGGYTRLLPVEDRYLYTRSQFEETIVWALGGYVAEELIFGEATTGASNDIERITSLARQMVTRYGMSSSLGPINLGQGDQMVFLGRDLGEGRAYGERTAEEIDTEVREIIKAAYERARKVLSENREILVRVSEVLIERETLEGEALEAAFGLPTAKAAPPRAVRLLPAPPPIPAQGVAASTKSADQHIPKPA